MKYSTLDFGEETGVEHERNGKYHHFYIGISNGILWFLELRLAPESQETKWLIIVSRQQKRGVCYRQEEEKK